MPRLINETAHGACYTRMYELKGVCDTFHIHAHKYGHNILNLKGEQQVDKLESENGPVVQSWKLYGYGQVFIPAGTWHRVKALTEESNFACIHAHKDYDGVTIETYCGNAGATV